MKGAADYVNQNWDVLSFVGAENAQDIGYAAMLANIHELPCVVTKVVGGLHSMNGILVKLRQSAIPASIGFGFYQYAKAGKSNLTSLLDSGMHPFQLLVNQAVCRQIRDGEIARDEARFTYTYLKGVTPERLFARCDTDAEGRTLASVAINHDELGGWAE